MQGRTHRLEHTPTPATEFANSLTTVPGQWLDTVTEHDHTDHALLHDSTIIHTKRGTIRGAVSKQMLLATIRNMHDKFKHTPDGYQTEDSTTSLPSLCQISDHPGANRTCANHPCTQTAHAACCQQDWTCRDCTHPTPLSPSHQPLLPPSWHPPLHIQRPTDRYATKTHTSPPRPTDSTSPTPHTLSHTKDTFQSCLLGIFPQSRARGHHSRIPPHPSGSHSCPRRRQRDGHLPTRHRPP